MVDKIFHSEQLRREWIRCQEIWTGSIEESFKVRLPSFPPQTIALIIPIIEVFFVPMRPTSIKLLNYDCYWNLCYLFSIRMWDIYYWFKNFVVLISLSSFRIPQTFVYLFPVYFPDNCRTFTHTCFLELFWKCAS